MNEMHLTTHKKSEKKVDLTKITMHTHEYYELYCFLMGDVKYLVEGNIYELKPGDLLIMKKSEAHSILINEKVPYERIVVFFNEAAIVGNQDNKLTEFIDNKPLGKNNRYTLKDLEGFDYLYLLQRMCKIKNKQQKSAYLSVIINELSKAKCLDGNYSDNAVEIIKYINDNITEKLTLEDICKRFFVSKTHLIRMFKALTGTTVWDYIVTKRIMKARMLLQSGERPYDVYSKCGFKDYCSFFKAYKSKFGVSPKQDFKNKKALP